MRLKFYVPAAKLRKYCDLPTVQDSVRVRLLWILPQTGSETGLTTRPPIPARRKTPRPTCRALVTLSSPFLTRTMCPRPHPSRGAWKTRSRPLSAASGEHPFENCCSTVRLTQCSSFFSSKAVFGALAGCNQCGHGGHWVSLLFKRLVSHGSRLTDLSLVYTCRLAWKSGGGLEQSHQRRLSNRRSSDDPRLLRSSPPPPARRQLPATRTHPPLPLTTRRLPTRPEARRVGERPTAMPSRSRGAGIARQVVVISAPSPTLDRRLNSSFSLKPSYSLDDHRSSETLIGSRACALVCRVHTLNVRTSRARVEKEHQSWSSSDSPGQFLSRSS